VPDADRNRQGEHAARDGFDEHEPAVEPEHPAAGEVTAGEVAGRVRQDRDDEDRVDRGLVVEQLVLDLVPERKRQHQEQQRQPGLDRRRHA
jgi:hypothetical protein